LQQRTDTTARVLCPAYDAVFLLAISRSYFLTYFCTRQFSVSATKISSRGLTAM
jgi:hypothetical protein